MTISTIHDNINQERAIWEEAKKRADIIAKRLLNIGKIERFKRMKDCAKTIFQKPKHAGIVTNLCRDRLCPICNLNRSKQLAKKLGKIINICEAEKHNQYIFLTTAIDNIPWTELENQIKIIMASWKRMNHRIRYAAVTTGWVKTFEVIQSEKYNNAHPHLQILLQVPPEHDLFHYKNDPIRQWKECLYSLQNKYEPSVSINTTEDIKNQIERTVAETMKYITKGLDIMHLNDTDLKAYIKAIHNIRAWSTGGKMKISDDNEIMPIF